MYFSYWILLGKLFVPGFFICSFFNVEFYNVDLRLNLLSLWLFDVLILLSSCVIINSIDYLVIMESYLFLIYISLFYVSMNVFILSNSMLITFLNWDLIGLISYLLINFWSSKVFCGIKAVVYNKFGDCFFLLILAFIYSLLFFSFSFDLLILFYVLLLYFNTVYIYIEWLSLCFLFIYLSKSAQFPFSSWLLNAMSAPTPISALLHSSTMVIAGVYLALRFNRIVSLFIDSYSYFLCLLLLSIIITLFWSLIIAFSISDIKSIIACSTISQISYMFLALLIFPLFTLFHIIIHALFKASLFLLSGSLIHIQDSFQSIYKFTFSSTLIIPLYIAGIIVLVFSFSKEGIIHCCIYFFNSTLFYLLSLLCGMLTTFYSLKVYIYCFYLLNVFGVSFNSFVFLTISSILIDGYFSSLFYYSSYYFLLNFGELFFFHYMSFFGLSFFLVLLCPWLVVSFFLWLFNLGSSFYFFSCYFFNRDSSFFIIPFQSIIYLFSLFFGSFFTSYIELFTLYSTYLSCFLLFYFYFLQLLHVLLLFTIFLVILYFSRIHRIYYSYYY